MKPPEASLMTTPVLPSPVFSANDPSTLIIRNPSAGFFHLLLITFEALGASAYFVVIAVRVDCTFGSDYSGSRGLREGVG